MADPGVLRGNLDEFRLVELLQVMGLSTNTGALHLRSGGGRTGLIYFERGALASCTELDTEALTLGHVLQQLDMVSAPQIEQAYQLQTQDPLGKRIGERLIDLGELTHAQLDQALQTQALWTLRELALWQSGEYDFHPGERLPADTAPLHIDITRAVMEALRYENEYQAMQPFLPDGVRTHISMAAVPPPGHRLAFDLPTWRIITLVNKHHIIRRIAAELHRPELDTARAIAPLVRQDLLTAVPRIESPGLPPEAARMSMHNFDLFSLLIEMEHDWLKRKSPTDQIEALASYVNRTMSALEQACHVNGLELSPQTLASLMAREQTDTILGYRVPVGNNRIDVADLAAFCRRALDGVGRANIGQAQQRFAALESAMERTLTSTFRAINARIASPVERTQNQEAWEALFESFRRQPMTG